MRTDWKIVGPLALVPIFFLMLGASDFVPQVADASSAIANGQLEPPTDARGRGIVLRLARDGDPDRLAAVLEVFGLGDEAVPAPVQPQPWTDRDPELVSLASSALAGLLGEDHWIDSLQDWIVWMKSAGWWDEAEIDALVKDWFAEEAVAYAGATLAAIDRASP